MRCNTVRKKFDRFTRQELAPRSREAIEMHLRECPDCRAYFARQERLAILLANAPKPPEVPEDFGARLTAVARQRRTGATVSSLRRPVWVSLGQYAARAAVLAAGLLLGVFMGQQTWQSARAAGGQRASQTDPLSVYATDSFSDAPGGSLTESYLALTTTPNHHGD